MAKLGCVVGIVQRIIIEEMLGRDAVQVSFLGSAITGDCAGILAEGDDTWVPSTLHHQVLQTALLYFFVIFVVKYKNEQQRSSIWTINCTRWCRF